MAESADRDRMSELVGFGTPTADGRNDDGGSDAVTVAASGLEVTVAPTGALTERLVAINERLSRLERDLADVAGRIDGVDPDAGSTAQAAPAPDEQWRSFLDLQRIVADRLDRR